MIYPPSLRNVQSCDQIRRKKKRNPVGNDLSNATSRNVFMRRELLAAGW